MPWCTDRAARAVELVVLSAVLWLPQFANLFLSEAPATSFSLQSEVLSLLWNLPSVALLLLVVRRAEGTLRRLGWRRVHPLRELLWAGLILIAAWIVSQAAWRVTGPSAPGPYTPPEGAVRALLPLTLLASALFEELFYRGFLQDRLERISGRRVVALLTSSVMFAAAHPYDLPGIANVWAVGLVLGLFRLQGRSLTRLVLAHWAFNLLIYFAL